ncbi:TetR-like C-terminal domain-containing protein [Leuconostoc palmae]
MYAYSIIESVFMNLVKNWVLNDFKESPDEFAEIVSKIIPKLYLDLIN